MYECPNCGQELDMEEICPKCGYDINTFLGCPYKISGNCIHTNQECNIQGLGYEECKIYLKQAGIRVKD